MTATTTTTTTTALPGPGRPAGEDALLARPSIRVVPLGSAARGIPEAAEEVPLPELRRLRLGEAPPPGARVIRVPTEAAGDERFSWDAANPAENREAKRFFLQMVAKGMIPHYVESGGRRSGRVMREFDATAEEILFSPAGIPRAVRGG